MNSNVNFLETRYNICIEIHFGSLFRMKREWDYLLFSWHFISFILSPKLLNKQQDEKFTQWKISPLSTSDRGRDCSLGSSFFFHITFDINYNRLAGLDYMKWAPSEIYLSSPSIKMKVNSAIFCDPFLQNLLLITNIRRDEFSLSANNIILEKYFLLKTDFYNWWTNGNTYVVDFWWYCVRRKGLPIKIFLEHILSGRGIQCSKKSVCAHDTPATFWADYFNLCGIHHVREQPRVPQFSERFPIFVQLALPQRR